MPKIIPLPQNMPQRADNAYGQVISVLEYAALHCTRDEWEKVSLDVKRMLCERMGCYDARDKFFPLWDKDMSVPLLRAKKVIEIVVFDRHTQYY